MIQAVIAGLVLEAILSLYRKVAYFAATRARAALLLRDSFLPVQRVLWGVFKYLSWQVIDM